MMCRCALQKSANLLVRLANFSSPFRPNPQIGELDQTFSAADFSNFDSPQGLNEGARLPFKNFHNPLLLCETHLPFFRTFER
jgi:hypothetical protein